jgi:phosphatidylinositol alpha-1,6-mannosyltransferase
MLLTENFPPRSGGSGRWFWELYTRLDAAKIVVVTQELSPEYENISHPNLDIIYMPLNCSEWGFKSVKGLTFYIRTVQKLRTIVKQHNISHIHCGRVIHEGVSAWLLSFLTRDLQYLCFVHGEDVETAAVSGEHNLMVKQVCKRATTLICNSMNSINILKRLNYATDEKVELLHPGVDCSKFTIADEDIAFKQKLGWENKFVVITVGRLQARKGHDRMIDAVKLLSENIPNIHYAIIGRGECKPSLEKQVKQLGIEKHVQFLSEISDDEMIACYQQCDLFILANRTIENDIEGFGMVLVEAQACGKVVIAGDSGGTRETMDVGSTGLIIDCADPKSIELAIKTLCESPATFMAMGSKGRPYVMENFDWTVHLRKASQIFS